MDTISRDELTAKSLGMISFDSLKSMRRVTITTYICPAQFISHQNALGHSPANVCATGMLRLLYTVLIRARLTTQLENWLKRGIRTFANMLKGSRTG